MAALTVHAYVNARLLRVPVGTTTPRRVSVLLPLRDEATRVGPCLRALLAQTGVAGLEVLVLDDGSTDGTAGVVRAHGLEPLPGAPLPSGWLGKPHACQQLADAATGEVLVFLDADVVLAPHAVAASVALLDDAGLDLVSPYPRQQAPGATRLVQPLLQWSWLTFLPLRLAERSARPSLSAANGQLLAVRREVYDRAGGHAAVRADVVEDLALLRAVKRVGGTGGVVDGTGLATTRMYEGWDELVEGYTKSLHTAPAAATVLPVLLYVVPLLRRDWPTVALGVLGRAVTSHRTGSPVWPDALTHPVSVALLAWLSVRSRRRARRGTLTWKGRPV